MAAQDLISAAEAKAWLKQTGAQNDALIATLITRASDRLETLTQRKLKARTVSSARLTGPDDLKLYVPVWPIDVTATITITVDGVAQTVWRVEADGDPAAFDVVVASDDPFDNRFGQANHFRRWQGWASALGWGWDGGDEPAPGNVVLSFTGGYATVPEDLKQACCYLVQKYFRDVDKQQTGMTVISVPQGGAVTIPDPSMPREVMDLIAPYCRGGAFAAA